MGKSDRKSRRHRTLGLMSYVSDGKSSFMGVVEDISQSGVRIAQIPSDFDDRAKQCPAVIQCAAGDFTLLLQPCWIRSTNRGMYKTIGFLIVNPPQDWQSILEQIEGGAGNELGFLVLGNDCD